MENRRYVKAMLTDTKRGPDGQKVYTFVASTEAEDRQGEVVSAGGWELDNYRRNSVVLDSHNYMSIQNIIGMATDVRQSSRGLEADIVFNGTERGRLAQYLVDSGNLKAVSVGFISKQVDLPKTGRGPLVHSRKELLEISLVAVPANPEALAVPTKMLANRVSEKVLQQVNQVQGENYLEVLQLKVLEARLMLAILKMREQI